MAMTSSTMRALGSPLPSFELPDAISQRVFRSSDLAGHGTVVAFICNHCPFVVLLKPHLAEFGRYSEERGVKVVAISSNDVATHPADGPEFMALDAQAFAYPFPYLYDESQAVARAFDAVCTPDFFLFDADGKLVYRGQFDDARPGNGVVPSGGDLKRAVDALVAGQVPPEPQKPSIGCNIKWKRTR